MCTISDGNSTAQFGKNFWDFSFTSKDRETFGNETFEIKIEDTSHYGTYSYSLRVKMFDSNVKVTTPSNTNNTEEEIIIEEKVDNKDDVFAVEFNLDSSPFAKYGDQFA